jgi:hypothetical protein
MIVKIDLPKEDSIQKKRDIEKRENKKMIYQKEDLILYTVIYPEEEKLYKPLVLALWERITENQRNKIVILHCDLKVFNFKQLINCYKHTFGESIIFKIDGNDDDDMYIYFENAGCCSCGVKIKNKDIITNKDDNKHYIIGCECIKWWYVSRKEINIIVNYDKENIQTHCPYCYRKVCNNCKPKQLLKASFNNLKKYVKDIKGERERIKTQKLNTLLEKKWKLLEEWLNEEYLKNKNSPKLLSTEIIEYTNSDEFLPVKLKPYYNYFHLKLENHEIYREVSNIVFKWMHYEKIFLNVPYIQKDNAKRMGAHFDGDKKRWYTFPYNTELIKKYT